MTSSVAPGSISACWHRLRAVPPLVQCLTNTVVQGFTANVLLAAGASPAMVDNPQEARIFAGLASGVLINLGTPQEQTAAAMREAAHGARDADTPWVLDPIGAGALPWRTQLARELLTLRPAIVRGNASEIIGLAGGAGGRGTDSTDSPEAALDAARRLADDYGCVVAVSGPEDHIVDGATVLRLRHGHVWMTKVTGVGCALGALMAACAGSHESAPVAATTATAALTLAAETAATGSRGPGTFAAQLLNELFTLEPAQLEQLTQLEDA